LPAAVHSLAIDGEDDSYPHLHVVVIDMDSQQRLCIPAYGADGEKVNKLVQALHIEGLYQGVAWVEIDNAKVIAFHGHHTGKLAKWIIARRRRITAGQLGKPIGQMSDAAVAQIVGCLLKMHAERPASTLTAPELKKVKQLAGALNVPIPKGL
jgi:hypothetical protein